MKNLPYCPRCKEKVKNIRLGNKLSAQVELKPIAAVVGVDPAGVTGWISNRIYLYHECGEESEKDKKRNGLFGSR